MQEELASLFTLDKNEGYTLRLEIWPNGKELEKNQYSWIEEFMIQPGDFNEENRENTMKRMNRFLRHYKKKPTSNGITKKKERTILKELDEIGASKTHLSKAIKKAAIKG